MKSKSMSLHIHTRIHIHTLVDLTFLRDASTWFSSCSSSFVFICARSSPRRFLYTHTRTHKWNNFRTNILKSRLLVNYIIASHNNRRWREIESLNKLPLRTLQDFHPCFKSQIFLIATLLIKLHTFEIYTLMENPK